MNNLCADIGYQSINHYGEELCGDHIDVVEQEDSSIVVVLADGLGSGVKASILSTFTIIRIVNYNEIEMIQYDNLLIILIRNGKNYDYPKTEMNIGGKKIYRTRIELKENDIFIAMSDGCPHAGIGAAYNLGWKLQILISL